MKNAVYACCNIDNEIVEIRNEIDAPSILYLASHTYNQPVKHKLILADAVATDENIKPISNGTFAYPNKTAIKKRKTINELCYLNRNDQFSYILHNQDMNLIKIEQNNIFITEIVKPKKKRPRKKKLVKHNNHVASLIKWEDLCFQPEIEAKYDCNVKPNNYVQYLNNPVCDPMFCQFDAIINDNHNCKEEVIHEFE